MGTQIEPPKTNETAATIVAKTQLLEEGWIFDHWAGTEDNAPVMKKDGEEKVILDGSVYSL